MDITHKEDGRIQEVDTTATPNNNQAHGAVGITELLVELGEAVIMEPLEATMASLMDTNRVPLEALEGIILLQDMEGIADLEVIKEDYWVVMVVAMEAWADLEVNIILTFRYLVAKN